MKNERETTVPGTAGGALEAPPAADGAGDPWRRPLLALGIVGVAAAVLLAFALSATSMPSNDGPGLLHFGRFFFENGRFARFSDYAAVPDADALRPLHHQWLAEILFYASWAVLGPAGIWVVKWLVLAAVAAALFRAGSGRLPLWFLALVFSVLVFSVVPRLLLRGDFASLGFMAVEVALLLHAARTGRWTLLYGLVPLQLAWINVHPTALLGVGILGLFVAEQGLRTLFREKKGLGAAARALRHALLALAGVILASCVTPYGPTLILMPLESFGGDARGEVFASIREFDPLGTMFGSDFLLAWKVLVVAAAAAAVAGLRRSKPWLVGSFAVTLAISLAHFRIYAFAAVAAAMLLADSGGEVLRRASGAVRKAAPFAAWASLAAAAAGALFSVSMALEAVKGTLFTRNGDMRTFWTFRDNLNHPWRAVAFVERTGIAGNCFNNYDTGSFLAFTLPRNVRIFIDTQFLYSDAFYMDYDRIATGAAPLEPVLETYGISLAVLKTGSRESARIMKTLLDGLEWKLVFLDECGAVLVPGTPPFAAIVREHEVKLDGADPRDLLSSGGRSEPKAWVNLADFLVRFGRVDLARPLYIEILEAHPRLFTAWNNLGVILMNEGDHRGALTCFVQSITRNGRFEPPRRNLRKLLEIGAFEPGDPDVERAVRLVE